MRSSEINDLIARIDHRQRVEIVVQDVLVNQRMTTQPDVATMETELMPVVNVRDTSGSMPVIRECNEYIRPYNEALREAFRHAVTCHQLRFGKTPKIIWCSSWIYHAGPLFEGCAEYAPLLRIQSGQFDERLETES